MNKIFTSTILDGPMTGNKKFYSENMTKEEVQSDLLKRRMELGKRLGFNGKKIIVPLQKNSNNSNMYKDGKYVIVDEEMLFATEDFWDIDIPTDIIMMRKSLTGVVLAYPVADCPVVIMTDYNKGITALAHCGAEYIDRKLPEQIVDSLKETVDSKSNDIHVYVGPCAGADTFDYDNIPSWTKNKKVWENNIVKKDKKYYINLRRAILKQLEHKNINFFNVSISTIDTINDPMYYSNNMEYKGCTLKKGRYLTGVFYPEDNNKKIL